MATDQMLEQLLKEALLSDKASRNALIDYLKDLGREDEAKALADRRRQAYYVHYGSEGPKIAVVVPRSIHAVLGPWKDTGRAEPTAYVHRASMEVVRWYGRPRVRRTGPWTEEDECLWRQAILAHLTLHPTDGEILQIREDIPEAAKGEMITL